MSGAFGFPVRRGLAAGIALAIWGSIVIIGCKKPAEITRYQVPKEKAVASSPSPSAEPEDTKTPGQDRMLAAIIPRGDSAWFFKLAGHDEAVSKHAEVFEALVQSVTFLESAGGEPMWKLPEGWKQTPGSEFRFATLVIPAEGEDKPMEVSVSKLPWRTEGESDPVLENVNRWRGQISLKPLEAAELDENIRKVKFEGGEATLVDLQGTLKDSGMRPPFATRPGGTEN